jgi:hypothetical protein
LESVGKDLFEEFFEHKIIGNDLFVESFDLEIVGNDFLKKVLIWKLWKMIY